MAFGQFATDARIAPKVRAVGVFDSELLCLREGEEVAGRFDHSILKLGAHTVSAEVKKSHLVGCLSQVSAELLGVFGASVKKGKIEDGKGLAGIDVVK